MADRGGGGEELIFHRFPSISSINPGLFLKFLSWPRMPHDGGPCSSLKTKSDISHLEGEETNYSVSLDVSCFVFFPLLHSDDVSTFLT